MLRISYALAGLLLSAAASAFAQSNAAPANVVTPAPAPREGTVGPEQLRDFALPGTRQPAPSETAPPATTRPAPQPAPRAAAPTPPAQAPAIEERRLAARAVENERRDAPAEEPARAPASEVTPPSALPPVVVTEPTIAPAAPLPQTSAPTPGIDARGAAGWPDWWPWALVAVLAGIGLALVFRRRGRAPMALAGGSADIAERTAADLPPPAPAPRVPAPQPQPQPPLPAGLVTTRLGRTASSPPVTPAPEEVAAAPTPPPSVPGGIVSRRLRGWVELDLAMREILFTEEEAILRFDLSVANSGAGSAMAVALEALPINAGEQQANELGNFFARPAASEVGIPELPPMGATMLSHELRMSRGAIRAYEAQGRSVFVPIIAFNASYRTAGQEARTSAAYLLGKQVAGSDRLAPLVLTEGAGRLLGLGVRQLEEMVRR